MKSVFYPYFASIAECQGNIVGDLLLTYFPCIRSNFCTVATFSVPVFLVNVVFTFFNTVQLYKSRAFLFCVRNITLTPDSVENYK